MNIEHAKIEDLSDITEIYNWAILNTTATFDTIPKTPFDQCDWFKKHTERFPIFVAKIEGKVVGWCSLSPWSDRCAYSDTGEISVYVKEDYQGKGIGKCLLKHLDQEAQNLGYHTLLSRIAGESLISIHLHKSLGFHHIGTMKEVGRKFGRFIDVNMMQKLYLPG